MVKHKVVISGGGEFDGGVDPLSTTLIGLKIFNILACNYLNSLVYDGDQFQKVAPKIDPRKTSVAVTKPQ